MSCATFNHRVGDMSAKRAAADDDDDDDDDEFDGLPEDEDDLDDGTRAPIVPVKRSYSSCGMTHQPTFFEFATSLMGECSS